MSDLGRVRSELRRLGYLDDSVERYLLQDALRPERLSEAVRHLAEKVALLVALPSTVALTWVLGAVNGHVRHAPFDLLPLFFHLLLPLALGIGLLFALFGGVLIVVLRLAHVRRIETVSYGVGMGAATLAVAVAVWFASALLLPALEGAGTTGAIELPGGRLWWLAIAVLPILGWVVFRAVHGALLTLAIRSTDQTPERPRVHGRRILGAFFVAAALALPIVLWASISRGAPVAPVALATGPGERVLVIGVDGVLGREVEWGLASGDAPTLARLLDDGGVLAQLEGASDEEPAARWTTLATGLPAATHGLATLDGYLPLGMRRPLVELGPLRPWLELLESTPLVSHRPRLAGSRRAATFWELVARGGRPTVTVGWWGTYPATRIAGAMVSHGSYQLMGSPEGFLEDPDFLEDTVQPPSVRPLVLATLSRDGLVEQRRAGEELAGEEGLGGAAPDPVRLEPPRSLPDSLAVAVDTLMSPEDRSALLELAVRPDRFYREVFDQLTAEVGVARVAALYLAGVDIAAAQASPSPVVVAELLRWQLAAVDAVVADSLDDFDAVFVAFDPGRRAREPGRLLLWRRGGCREHASSGRPKIGDLGTTAVSADSLTAGAVTAGSVTGAILRLAGLPQSAELPEPPAVCDWPAASAEIETFGARRKLAAGDSAVRPEEYLEQLRSLGYL